MHKSQILLYSLLAFLVGVFAARYIDPPHLRILFYLLPIVGIVFSTVFWGRREFLLLGFLLLAVSLGLWRYQQSQPVSSENLISSHNDTAKISWEGIVVEEPDVRADRINLVVEALCLPELDSGPTQNPSQPPLNLRGEECDKSRGVKVSGRVLLSVGRYPEYDYGDYLSIKSKLETPFETEDFSYKNYLAKDGIYTTSRFPEVGLLVSGQGSAVKGYLLSFKKYFSERIAQVLSEPQSSLLLGLLVGARRGLPDDVLENFRVAGVTHIIAISGFNISIITRILGSFFRKWTGVKGSLFLTSLLVVGFVIITGAQASVVRAAIMGVLVVLAMNLGRVGRMLNVLLLTAAVMVFINPQILAFDIGFQLSFLATAGLLFFADDFENLLHRVPKALEIRTSLAATLSAQIAVLPLLVYYFDQLSLVSPIANVLILPLIPPVMLVGFIAGLLALVWLPLTSLAAWPAWLALGYIIKVAELAAVIPFAAISIENLSVWVVAIYFIALSVIAMWFWRKRKMLRIKKFREFSPEVK